ncbi:RraA family protein [Pseudonocardia sp. TRM90224]|uniref:RraA family protein n=1 Tax=Pseudonocardia sp. TRM90224 TaxID=2812678 RepID=UPI001E2CF2CC|nr:RraA family protein [Pseudonocardia sp. TRM90224]
MTVSTGPDTTSTTGRRVPDSASIHPGPGFRIRLDFPRLPDELVQAFREFSTTDISDLLNRLYALDAEIRCLAGGDETLVGLACTVRAYLGDNLMVHKSLDVAKEGDVVVVTANGSHSYAVIGDVISTKARHRGIAGFVVDGMIRDLPSIEPIGMPVYARGTTPVGPLHRGPGEINYPIACGGVVVNPGDVVVADKAGVVIVPQQVAAELLERLRRYVGGNAAYLEAVQRGEFSNSWVDQQLEANACPIDPGVDTGAR